MSTPLTGRKVLAIAVGAFGVIIAANLTMLFAATGSFPGLVVKNSYVAGVGWNDRVAAQEALGWTTEIAHQDGRLAIAVTTADGQAVRDLVLVAKVGRPSNADLDYDVTLAWDGAQYGAEAALAPGLWRVEINTADGPAYRVAGTLDIRETRP